MNSLRIGIDASVWQNRRGYGRHARALLRTLIKSDPSNRYTFFLDSTEDTETLPGNIQVRHIKSSAPTTKAASANGHRSAADMWRMSRAMSTAKLDLLLFPTVYSYVPVFSRSRKIVMIHDVIAEKYPALTLPHFSARLFWKTKVALGRWQADAIATVSDYSRRQIVEHFRMSPERVHVVSEASDSVFRRLDNPELTPALAALGVCKSDRMIVYVGGFGPHKNLEALVNVFAKLSSQSDLQDVKLVLVGEFQREVFHSYANFIQAQVARLNLADRVLFTGYLSDQNVVVLLNLATVSVLPSLIEGFGLPAVEAAACGCPVVATQESPLPSLLGQGGLYFNPTDEKQLETKLSSVLRSKQLREDMSSAGRAAAANLTWERAAQQLMTLIQKVVTP